MHRPSLNPVGKEHIRVSDADREQVVDRLRNAMGEGRLTLPEFDERLQHVYAAKTFGELQPVLHDLPVQRNSAPPPSAWHSHRKRSRAIMPGRRPGRHGFLGLEGRGRRWASGRRGRRQLFVYD